MNHTRVKTMSEAQDIMNKLLKDEEAMEKCFHELQHIAADKAEDEFLISKIIQDFEDKQRGK